MQILLLGATGRTGTLVLQEALQRNHTVTALVRGDPSALNNLNLTPAQKSYLNIIRGSPLNAEDVTAAVTAAARGASLHNETFAVISTLNPRRTSDNPWAAPHPTDSPPRMMADSIANVLTALSDVRGVGGLDRGKETTTTHNSSNNMDKIVHLSAMGVGDSVSQTPWAFRALVAHSNVKHAYADHEAVEAELRQAANSKTGVAWVSVRAARLVDGGGEKSVLRVWGKEKGRVGFMATSARRAVAKFMVDAAESSEWDGKTPLVVD